MSSLAGALLPPVTESYNAPPSPKYEDHTESEVFPAGSDDDEGVEEHNPNYDNDQDGKDEEMEDLFGNDAGVEESMRLDDAVSSAAQSRQDSERLPSPERQHRHALEYEEDEEPAQVDMNVKEAEITFPNIPVPQSSDGNNWVIRMPNYMHVDSKPFDPEYYYGPEHYEEDTQQSHMNREKSMSIKLKVENSIRWRWVRDGSSEPKRQTNTRIIRWSDGSLSLRLGKELFDVVQNVDNSATVPRNAGTPGSISQSQSQSVIPQSQPQSQSQSQSLPSSSSNPTLKPQGLTYLVAQHKRAQVLQSEALVTGYMTLRPTGMQSDTHRMLVKAVGQKHNKVARLRMAADPTIDPEREVQELAKASAKRSKKKLEESGGRKKRRGGQRRRNADVWSDDDDDEGAVFQAGSEDEYEEGGGASGSPDRRKGGRGEGKASEYQEDDFLVADDSSEDGAEGGSKKKRSEEDKMEDDPLDKIEEKLEKQEKAKQRHNDEDGDNDGMDIESEEEEDDQEVRRVGVSTGGSRKRRALEFDEDEDE